MSETTKPATCRHINQAGHEWETWCTDCGERWPNNLHRQETFVPVEAPALGATTLQSEWELLVDAWKVFLDALPDGEYKGLGELRLRFSVLSKRASAPVAREGQAPAKTATEAVMEGRAPLGSDYWWDRWKETDEGTAVWDRCWPDEIATIACKFADWFAQECVDWALLKTSNVAESVVSPRAPETPKETVDVQSAPSKESNT